MRRHMHRHAPPDRPVTLCAPTVFVADALGKRVNRYASNGTLIASWPYGGEPRGIAVSPTGVV